MVGGTLMDVYGVQVELYNPQNGVFTKKKYVYKAASWVSPGAIVVVPQKNFCITGRVVACKKNPKFHHPDDFYKWIILTNGS
jgi:hypothetical protein